MRKLCIFALLLAALGGSLSAQTPSGAYSSPAGGSSVSPNSPIPQSQVGPGFNVRNYGAKGDTQTSNVGVTNGTTTVTCANCAFTSADVGKTIFAHTPLSAEAFNSLTTISSVTNGTTIIVSQAAAVSSSGMTLVWGHLDDTAVSAAVTAFNAAIKGVAGNGSLGVITASPVLYFPAGNYLLCTTLNGSAIAVANFSQLDGYAVIGDGPDQSIVTAGSGAGCPVQNNNAGMLLDARSGNGSVRDITFDGAYNVGTAGAVAVSFAGAAVHLERVNVLRWNTRQNIAALLSSSGIYMDVVTVLNNGKGFVCQACNGEIYKSIFSNNQNNPNLTISNVIGLNFGNGLHIINSIVDECGSQANGCTQIINSNDVWLAGGAYFSTNSGQSINVDGTSFVHMNGGIAGVFGADSNSTGLAIQAGGVVQASDVRFVSSGTGKCINNSGRFQDNGGNTCENMFQIASGTSTGTTAVLTLTNVGAAVNTNCSIGDALMVQGAGVVGYNGYYPAGAITATSATTLTYTTAGSNLGAAGAGGTAYCRNLQTFTGTLPVALLNNPIPNTCYYTITPIANATAVTLCNFSTGTATNITRIRASSQVVTTCATAPIITISDGTATQTLTLTSAKSSWDSAVDASTGVGTTIFKPNGTITVKYDVAAASACATPATNLAVSYNISPILSN